MLSVFKDRAMRVWRIAMREVRTFEHRPLLIFCMLIAPIFCVFFFTDMMSEGLPAKLPAGLVDEDDTQTTRQIVRILGSMRTTDLSKRYATFSDAHAAMLRGEIYAFMYIPAGTTQEAIASRQPKISFYTSDVFFLPASLLMKDLRTISEMTGMAITRATLQAKGLNNGQIMGVLRPIVVEAHPLTNSYLNYSILLTNGIVPGIIIILILLTTAYAIGMEWKRGTQKSVFRHLADNSVPIFLTGKLLPQTILYTLQFWAMYVYLYVILDFPCLSGMIPMMLIAFITVLAAQAFSVVVFGIFAGQMRLSMSACALFGVLSISLAGFSYPTTAMYPVLQWVASLLPLRNYFLLYANQALNGYPIVYAWQPLLMMFVTMALPLLFLRRYRTALTQIDYKP